MGTSRVLKIDPRDYPRIGTVQYQDTLPLNEKEVVLTFDDGPLPPYTNRVLEALKHECVRANYFVVGRMARGYPDLLRQIVADGHVIGTHSENHPLAFEKMPLPAARQEIDKGFASTTSALGGAGTVAPFFRFPGLLRGEPVEGYLQSRSMVTWSADVVADDWKHITASEVVSRSLARLDAKGKGILLLHDIQPATALALPHLLRELKRRGYKIVQVVPETAAAMVAAGTRPAGEARPQPQRETSTWPTPYPARSATAQTPSAAPVQPAPAMPAAAAQTRPAAGAPRQNEPAIAAPPTPGQASPALEDIVTQIAGAQAAARAATGPADPADLPSGRALPVPIMEAARLAPGASLQKGRTTPVLARPLTPGFKPSHSASLPAKIQGMPVEPEVPEPPAPPAIEKSDPAQADPNRRAQDQPAAVPADRDEPRAQGDPAAEQPGQPAEETPQQRIIDVWSGRASLTPPVAPKGPWPVTAWSLRAYAR